MTTKLRLGSRIPCGFQMDPFVTRVFLDAFGYKSQSSSIQKLWI